MTKNILIINNNSIENKIELAIGLATFDLNVSILFCNETIQQLTKNYTKYQHIQALETYDITKIYVFNSDLDKYNLNPHSDLLIKCEIIQDTNINNIYKQYSVIL